MKIIQPHFICASFALISFNLVGQTPSGSNVPGPDRAFAIMAAETDMAEIEIGNLALKKSQSDEVKKLAQKLVEDHTKTSGEMKEIASSKKLPLPKKTDSKHRALIAKLEGESGGQFDKDFLAANSMDHHRVITAFKKESNDGKDQEIMAFAEKNLPAIEKHSAMIDQEKNSPMK